MVLGIDLGTSNSMAAVYREGKPVIIESRTGKKQIPSVVSMDREGNFFAGDVAKERQIPYPDQTVSAFKRYMGTKQMFHIGEKELNAVELSAIILRNIKADAEQFLGEKVEEAVISVPAFFSNPQRKAVLQAGELAGFRVRQLINEPTAAAMAYGMQEKPSNENIEDTKVIMVMDLGGGTFDISIVEQTGNIMEVVSVCGDNHLGGEDFTKRLMQMFLKAHGIEGVLDKGEKIALWKQAEQAKRMFAVSGMGKMKCSIKEEIYEYEMTEHDYEKACFDLLEKMRKLALRAVEESKYEMEEISDILMVGGGLKLSIVQKMIKKLAGKPLDYKVNPDEAVVLGAALTGHLLEQNFEVKDLIMTDICPFDLGCGFYQVRSYDLNSVFQILMKRNTTIPAKRVDNSIVRAGEMVVFSLLQMNKSYVDEAIELGGIWIPLPETPDNSCHLQYTIIYDMNGIVKVQVYIQENQFKKEMLIYNENCELTMEEARNRMNQLEYLKATPLEEEKNKLLYARAERMYMECTGKEREYIGICLEQFEQAVASYDDYDKDKILNAREVLEKLLNRLEKSVF